MYNFTVMHRNEPVAQVQISDDHMNVRIEKIIPDSLIQPFGGNDLSLNRVYCFLKSRCYEDDRADLQEILNQAELKENNPWQWNRITHGVTWEDDLWIKFDGEELEWENVRWRK
ncbi:MAG: hypothetical protein HDR17_01070 [Lachnospiraceae bacterium]|nr:hypothetical protein [Lachnospiraceae bacterium]